MGITNVRAAVKAATAELHAEAERDMASFADLSTTVGYRKFAQVMFTVLARFEAAADHGAALAGIEPRSAGLLRALQADIQKVDALDVRPIESLDADSPASALGVAYAIEGSALGAAVLRRRLGPDVTARYLDALVTQRHDRWPKLTAELDRLDPNALPCCVAAAAGVFDAVRATIRLLSTDLPATEVPSADRVAIDRHGRLMEVQR